MARKTKKTLITTERYETFAVSQRKRQIVRGFCNRCSKESNYMMLDSAVSFTGMAVRELLRLVDSGEIHSVETASGHLFVCAQSCEQLTSKQTKDQLTEIKIMLIKNAILIFVIVAAAVIGLTNGNAVLAFDDDDDRLPGLRGSWNVLVTPVSDPSAQFREMMTFDIGGGITENNTFPFYQIGMKASGGHGTWRYIGTKKFRFTFVKYLFTTADQNVGTLKVSGTILYSRKNDTWSSEASVAICDVETNNCNVIDTTGGAATRIAAD